MSMESSAKRKLLALLIWVAIIAAGLLIVNHYWKPLAKAKLESQTGSQSQYKHRITLRADSFSGYCILRSPEMKNMLGDEGIGLSVEDDKADYPERMKALAQGNADMAVFTVDSFLKAGARLDDFPATIVAVIDETKDADAVVAWKTAAASIQDLNKPNAGLVLTPDSPSEFMGRILVSDFNLPNLPADWLIPAKDAADVLAKFQQASRTDPKGYVLWEPYVSKALKDPNAHVLLGSGKLRGYILDVLVARRQFLKDQPDLVKSVVTAYLKSAYMYSQKGLLELIRDDANAGGEPLTVEEAQQLAKGIQWKNTLENYAHFGITRGQEAGRLPDMEEIILKVERILYNTKALPRDAIKPAPTTLFYDKILRDLQASNFHPDQKLGVVQRDAPPSLDKVRGDADLPALSDKEWDSLLPVGQMKVDPISFLRGTYELSVQAGRDLEELAGRLKSFPNYYLLICGRARAEGDAEANMQLAGERAKAVADRLVGQLGISGNRVRTVAQKPAGDDGSEQSVVFQLKQRAY